MRVESALKDEFPGLRVVELELTGLSVTRSDPRLEAMKQRVAEETRVRRPGLDALKDEPLIRAYRDFYWRVGVDPTKTRPAGEALTRRVLGGKTIPTINTLVDVYNLVSLTTSVAIAAFDAAHVSRPALSMRRARAGESFLGIGMDHPMSLRGNEVVIDDAHHSELIAVYPYRDAERSKIRDTTNAALLLMCGVPGIGDEALEDARRMCHALLSEFCRGPG